MGLEVSLMYENAIRRLVEYGCDKNYVSSAVDDSNQTIESCVHELAHAVVARVLLDKDAAPIKKYGPNGLTNRIGLRLSQMNRYQNDRNEEITLAVEMLVLDSIGVPYDPHAFVTGVAWYLKERDHYQQIRQAIERKATRKHANTILRYLRHLEACVDDGAASSDLRPAQSLL